MVSQILDAMSESEQKGLRKLSLLYNTWWIGGGVLFIIGGTAGGWGWQAGVMCSILYMSGVLFIQRKLVEFLARTTWSVSQGVRPSDIHKGLITNGFTGQRNR